MMAKMGLTRAIRSEAIKLRRTPLTALHVVLAVVLGGSAGAYFSYAPWNSLLGTDAFFQLVGTGAPLIVGISCGLAIDAEREAGDGANLLGIPSRRTALAAKGVVLWLMGMAAALIAGLLFFSMLAAVGRDVPPFAVCLIAALGIAVGSAPLYAVFLWIALRFGRNAAIGMGALGFGIALASMGGLANGLVTGTLSGSFGLGAATIIPFSWPSRLASLVIELAIAAPLGAGASASVALIGALGQIGAACGVTTAALIGVMLAWANRFEDKRPRGE